MKSNISFLRCSAAARTPLNYIAGHIPKKDLPPSRKLYKSLLFDGWFQVLKPSDMHQRSGLAANKVNIWIKGGEGRRVVKSKLVNSNRDLVIELLELFCTGNTYISLALHPPNTFSSCQILLAHQIMGFLSESRLFVNRNPDLKARLEQNFGNCSEMTMHLRAMSDLQRFAYFYFLSQNSFQAEFNCDRMLKAKEKIQGESNVYNLFLNDKVVDERLVVITTRRYIKTIEVDPVVQRRMIHAVSCTAGAPRSHAILRVLDEFIAVYRSHKKFFNENFEV
jgi:hypothetical protein